MDEQVVFPPADRADAARSTEEQQRPRKHLDGKTLRRKNVDNVWELGAVTIASGSYDKIKHKWMYKLKDEQGNPIDGQTEEKRLG